MRIKVHDDRGVRVLACRGTILLEGGAEELVRRFGLELADPGLGIVLDLTELTYLDSAGVGAVVACWKQASASGVVTKIALAPSGPVRKIFEVTQLAPRFELFDAAASAVSSFE